MESKVRNEFFKRLELNTEIENEKNPLFDEVAEIISKEEKKDKELVVVKSVKGKFGSNKFNIKANVYDSKEDKERFEPKSKKEEVIEKKVEGEEKKEEINVEGGNEISVVPSPPTQSEEKKEVKEEEKDE